MSSINKPIGTMLFLGPTGSGKTHVVESAAYVLFGNSNAVIKIDCAELQHSHEIAKLIGSPPGYLGHRETAPMLAQENIDRYRTEENPFSLVLFDEIEKASDALWQLLLGILDKAKLTLGDNRNVDFSQTMILMTSNLGAREMSDMISGNIGFAPNKKNTLGESEFDHKIYKVAHTAAKRKFSPEFMNRIDKTIVFRSLEPAQLQKILDLELRKIQQRIFESETTTPFLFKPSQEAKQFLIREGTELHYGARHLKRAVERFVVQPLSNLVATKQVRPGDVVEIDYNPERNKLEFFRNEELSGTGYRAA